MLAVAMANQSNAFAHRGEVRCSLQFWGSMGRSNTLIRKTFGFGSLVLLFFEGFKQK